MHGASYSTCINSKYIYTFSREFLKIHHDMKLYRYNHQKHTLLTTAAIYCHLFHDEVARKLVK